MELSYFRTEAEATAVVRSLEDAGVAASVRRAPLAGPIGPSPLHPDPIDGWFVDIAREEDEARARGVLTAVELGKDASRARRCAGPFDKPGRTRPSWLELAAMTALACYEPVFDGLAVRLVGDRAREFWDAMPAEYLPAWTVTKNVVFILVVLFVAIGHHRDPERFGLVRARLADLATGAALLAMSVGAIALASRFLPPAPQEVVSHVRSGPIGLEVLNAATRILATELFFRAYLVPQLTLRLGSPGFAVLATAALYAACYLGAGLGSAWLAFCCGLLWGTAFLAVRRLAPLVLARFGLEAIWVVWAGGPLGL